MQKKVGRRQYLTLFLLFGITTLLLGFTVDVDITDRAGVRTELPETLPVSPSRSWTGHDVLFCHNQLCGRSWLVKDLPPSDDGIFICPRDYSNNPCGGKLHSMALGEYQVLPKDTVIYKKQYFLDQDPEETVFASVVLSGNDRSSIHRPELCMTGQGHTIDRTYVLDVPLPGRDNIGVMVMELSFSSPNPRQPVYYSYYAYWFVGYDKETPHHLERTLWMGYDRIIRNVAHRWAYIALAGARDLDTKDHEDRIREVVSSLYPQISLIGTDAE